MKTRKRKATLADLDRYGPQLLAIAERKTLSRLLAVYPTGIVSYVSDTYDFWNLVGTVLPALKPQILARNGKLVIRPDSGDPVKILVGDPESPDPMVKEGLVATLYKIFGGSQTHTGHRVLDSHIGCIYGDSITLDRQKAILEGLHQKGYASCNVVLGIGSYTYQCVTRDTFGWAIKATAAEINGELKALYKKPKTDDGTKNSARGLVFVNPDMSYRDQVSWDEFTSNSNQLQPVYRDGKILRVQSLDEIRKLVRTS